MGSGDNRFIFKKRLFKNSKELSQDPVEVNMLYAQAVYNVVKVIRISINFMQSLLKNIQLKIHENVYYYSLTTFQYLKK